MGRWEGEGRCERLIEVHVYNTGSAREIRGDASVGNLRFKLEQPLAVCDELALVECLVA